MGWSRSASARRAIPDSRRARSQPRWPRLDATLSFFDVAALDERMSREAAPVGFAALLMNLYGVLALLLAALGVYGVLAAGVASRRRELAIRAALGAAPQRLWLGVVREGLTVAIASVACGVAITLRDGSSDRGADLRRRRRPTRCSSQRRRRY